MQVGWAVVKAEKGICSTVVVAEIAALPGIVVEAGTAVVVYPRMQVGWAVVKAEKGICSTVVVEAVGMSAEEVEVEIVVVEVEAGMFVGEAETGMVVWQVGLAEQVVVGKFDEQAGQAGQAEHAGQVGLVE